MARETFRLNPASGRPLEGVLDLPDRDGHCPVVVICHGFKGFLEWGFFPQIAELLCQRGFAVVRFNFSGAGMRLGDERVTDRGAFRDNTLAREVEDLGAVLEALGDEIGPGKVDVRRLGILGHSRGGGGALLASASDAWRDRISSLVTWAAIGRTDRFPAKVLDEWRQNGELPLVNARTQQRLLLGPALLEEIVSQPPELDLSAAAGRRTAPWLIVHGADDETVPADEARQLAEAASGEVVLRIVPDGSHTFGARHPWSGPTPALIETFNATQSWLRKTLG